MLPLFDEPPAARVPRPRSTKQQNDDYWRGHQAALAGQVCEAPSGADAGYWMDGWRLGALCRPRPRAVRINNGKGQR